MLARIVALEAAAGSDGLINESVAPPTVIAIAGTRVWAEGDWCFGMMVQGN